MLLLLKAEAVSVGLQGLMNQSNGNEGQSFREVFLGLVLGVGIGGLRPHVEGYGSCSKQQI